MPEVEDDKGADAVTHGGASGAPASMIEGLVTWPSEEPRLIAGRCKSCGAYFFPKFVVTHKADCRERVVEEVLLSRRGKLDTYTVQRFAPPAPFVVNGPFVPYAIGWVALPEGIAVAGMLTGCNLEEIRLNMEVELVVEPAWVEQDGTPALTWKWRPVANGGGSRS